MQLRAKLLDLEMYNVKWAPGKDVWQINGEMLSMINDVQDIEIHEGLEAPQWQHEDLIVVKPTTPSLKLEVGSKVVIAYFDGGSV